MKKSFFTLLFVLFTVNFYSQEKSIEDNDVYSSAGIEVLPEFPGGQKAFGEYFSKNYKYPNVKGLKGRVFVEFVIEKDGSIGDIKVLRDLGYGTGEEAIRVLKESPLWKPGMQEGKLIRVKYALPINVDII